MGSILDPLRALPLDARSAGFLWLGQAGFAIRLGGATALVDPFLSPYDGRVYESALASGDASGIDLVLCTHEHVDHFDAVAAPAIAAASPEAVFVVPTPIVDLVTEAGIPADRVVGLQPGEPRELAGVTVRAVPAMHGVTMEDAYGFGEMLSDGLVRFLGFLLEAEAFRAYHAGDTIHYDGMEDLLRPFAVDVAMLPINGRDPEREARDIVGNLSEREAAWLAAEIDAGMLLPMHYDLFARNRGEPSELVHAAERDGRNVPVLVPPRERAFVLTSSRER